MNYLKEVREILEVTGQEPFMVVFLVSMGLVGFALYIILQAIRKKEP